LNAAGRCDPCAARALREPPAVPAEFWDAAGMRDALATWHMGRVFFAYRTHPWHRQPLKQSVVAGWLGLTQAQLSRIERGRAPEELSKLVCWARLLRIPAGLLWFKMPGDAAAPAPDTAAKGLMVPVVVGGRAVLLPVDEQAARARGLSDLLARFAGRDAGEDIGLPTVPPALAVPQAVAPEEVAGLDRLAAALDDARYLDGSAVEVLRGYLDRCKADDGASGPARALPLTLGILGVITRHAREAEPGARVRLLSLGADCAEFVGWLYRDLRDLPTALYWYDRAMEWAQAAHDPAMQGYVLLRKSQMAYDERDACQVATLAGAAANGPWQLPRKVRAEAVQQEARGLAMLGEPFGTVERKLDEADDLFAAADGDSGRDGFGGNFSAAALLTRRACTYIEAGKPAAAAGLFGEAVAGSALSRRDEGFFRALRAFAYALSGEPDAAAEEGMTALGIARATSSERTVRELRRTVRVLGPWASRPEPRRLTEALL
jgi:hypothetical protein